MQGTLKVASTLIIKTESDIYSARWSKREEQRLGRLLRHLNAYNTTYLN